MIMSRDRHLGATPTACPLCRTRGPYVSYVVPDVPALADVPGRTYLSHLHLAGLAGLAGLVGAREKERERGDKVKDKDKDKESSLGVFNPCGHLASLQVCQYWAAEPGTGGPLFRDFLRTALCPPGQATHNNPSHVRAELHTDQNQNQDPSLTPSDYCICPYCATHLHPKLPYSRLLPQCDDVLPNSQGPNSNSNSGLDWGREYSLTGVGCEVDDRV